MELHLFDISRQPSTSNADSDVVFTSSSPSSDWIKRAVHLRRYRQADGSDYRLINLPAAPTWITNPSPIPNRRWPRARQSVLAERRWRDRWRERDWEAAEDFFKTSEVEEAIHHDIIRQL